ncbi:MAG: alpha/beta hydrolase [Bacteriovoracaceae bacterium]|nr:alpha/beta hydrolase [Bacteriovoracaceae bacterium]
MQLYSNFHKTTDGEQLFYTTNFPIDFKTSHKKVVLFNYGLVCSNLHWKFQLQWFHDAGYKILFHDYRGHFQSSGKDNLERITFVRIAEDIKELLEHLKISEVAVIGHSMGVNITLELARRNPDLVKAMCLLSGTTLPVKGVMFDTNLMEYILPVTEEILKRYREAFQFFWDTQAMNPLTLKLIHNQGFNEKQVGRDFIEVYMNRVAQLGPDLFLQLFMEMQRHDVLGDLDTMTMPALVIGGDKDRVIPFHLQHLLHQRLANSELYIIKEGSHVPQVDFPEFTNNRMHLFLENHFS